MCDSQHTTHYTNISYCSFFQNIEVLKDLYIGYLSLGLKVTYFPEVPISIKKHWVVGRQLSALKTKDGL